MIKRGINFPCSNNICFSHKEKDIDETSSVFNESVGFLSGWTKGDSEEKKFEGKIIRPVFQRY